jgi:hypothetical protein
MTTSHSELQALMTHSQDRAISQNDLASTLDATLSLWQELRLTSMSGADYLFIPNFILDALDSAYALSRFIDEISLEFCIEKIRLQLIGIGFNNDEPHYSRAIIEWQANCVSSAHTEAIPQSSEYKSYIDSLYQYSSALVSPTEH